jgi:hypothetical protein
MGVLLEPIAAAAAGPVLGFIITTATEAAVFTTLSYFLVEKHPTMQGFKNELGKNVIVFGVLKGISKAFAGLEKVFEVELKEAEAITQFATVNGIGLYDANKEKAKRGEKLTEADEDQLRQPDLHDRGRGRRQAHRSDRRAVEGEDRGRPRIARDRSAAQAGRRPRRARENDQG